MYHYNNKNILFFIIIVIIIHDRQVLYHFIVSIASIKFLFVYFMVYLTESIS